MGASPGHPLIVVQMPALGRTRLLEDPDESAPGPEPHPGQYFTPQPFHHAELNRFQIQRCGRSIQIVVVVAVNGRSARRTLFHGHLTSRVAESRRASYQKVSRGKLVLCTARARE